MQIDNRVINQNIDIPDNAVLVIWYKYMYDSCVRIVSEEQFDKYFQIDNGWDGHIADLVKKMDYGDVLESDAVKIIKF